MNSKTQEKLVRITQIQQDIFNLEKELDELLGTSAPRQAPAPRERRGNNALRNARESRENLRGLILDMSRSMPVFSTHDVFNLAESSQIGTSRMQIAQLCNWLAKKGDIALVGTKNGVKSYSMVINR